MSLIRCQ